MSGLLSYIAAWKEHDAESVAARVTENCLVAECYGPVYRGRDRVRGWAAAWFAAGGVIHSWEISDHFVAGEREAAQWRFDCTWAGKRESFEGCSIGWTDKGLVSQLREYQTTAPLYEWTGQWR